MEIIDLSLFELPLLADEICGEGFKPSIQYAMTRLVAGMEAGVEVQVGKHIYTIIDDRVHVKLNRVDEEGDHYWMAMPEDYIIKLTKDITPLEYAIFAGNAALTHMAHERANKRVLRKV